MPAMAQRTGARVLLDLHKTFHVMWKGCSRIRRQAEYAMEPTKKRSRRSEARRQPSPLHRRPGSHPSPAVWSQVGMPSSSSRSLGLRARSASGEELVETLRAEQDTNSYISP